MFNKQRNQLNEKQRQKILDKIEKEYQNYAQIYGKKVFNIKNFYERYNRTIRLGYNEESFLLAEIQAVLTFHQKKQSDIKTRKEKKSVISDLFTEYQQRMQKYTKKDIHTDAEPEIEYLLGAIIAFEQTVFPLLYKIYQNIFSIPFKNKFKKIEYNLHQLTGSRDKYLPPEFALYKKKIDASSDREQIQKEGHIILKKVFEVLNLVQDFTESVNREESYIHKLNFNYKEKKYSYADLILVINEKINALRYDFRLKGLADE
ncbi:MAG TPA: hypothetical protein VKS21_06325 [Spirochaetota bacterium]|nr:hypothetical protein [Spirochaetota bacterium]